MLVNFPKLSKLFYVKAKRTSKKAARAAKAETPRVARLERRRAQSREEILEATRRLILRDGVGITLDAIAEEVGLTKAALYYYYPSKDALLFEIVYRLFMAHGSEVEREVASTKSGADALAAIIRSTVKSFAPRMADYRLAFLHGQVGGPDAVKMLPEFFARIRPINDLAYGGATKRLEEEGDAMGTISGIPARRLAFLAHVAAIGLLTMKGMVESVGDPLLYSDDVLIGDLSRIFAAATWRGKPT